MRSAGVPVKQMKGSYYGIKGWLAAIKVSLKRKLKAGSKKYFQIMKASIRYVTFVSQQHRQRHQREMNWSSMYKIWSYIWIYINHYSLDSLEESLTILHWHVPRADKHVQLLQDENELCAHLLKLITLIESSTGKQTIRVDADSTK